MKSLVILMEAVQWDHGSGLKESGWEGAEERSCRVAAREEGVSC